MNLKRIMLKVCYKQSLRYISVTQELSLRELMDTKRFSLDSNNNVLELCENSGEVFTEETYKRFIDNFPKSNRILYVRPFYLLPRNQVREEEEAGNLTREEAPRNTKTVLRSTQFKIPAEPTTTSRNYAAPLRRLDCFLHVYPEEFSSSPPKKLKISYNKPILNIRN